MKGERQRGGPSYIAPYAQNSSKFCVFLLAICFAYDSYSSIVYLTSLQDGIFDFARRPIGRDFVNYWTAGVAVFDGKVPEIFRTNLFHAYQEQLLEHPFAVHSWSYPPHMLLLVWPLGLMPYLWALAAWSAVTLGLYLWAVKTQRQDRHLLVLALLLAPATCVNFAGGQNGFLTGALLIGGLRLLGPKPIVAGILFGILTVKPQLGLLLPFALVAARQWTAIVAASLTAAALIGASIMAFGWESWNAYIEWVMPNQAALMSQGQGIFLAMMPSAYIGLRLLEAEPVVRLVLQGAVSAGALAGVVWAFARTNDWELRLAAIALGTFLASPYCFNYDMTTVGAAVALMALRGLREGFLPGERVVLAATWLLPILLFWLNLSGMPVSPLILLAALGYVLARVAAAPSGAPGTFSWGGTAKLLGGKAY